MDFYNFFKSFLGIPNSVPPSDFNSERYKDYVQDGHDNLFRSDEEDDESIGFHMFSNPIEMHRYFEQQMNEVMRAFGLPADRSIFGDFFKSDIPAIEPPSSSVPETPESLREQFLKPGYDTAQKRTDSDLDDQVNLNDIETILKSKHEEITPYKRPPTQHRFFGQSMSSKTIVKPDGTVETEQIVRDNQGNEEVTVTYKSGDEEHTVVTRTDKDGKRVTEETRTKLDKSGVDLPSVPGGSFRPGWFNLDGFFKR